MEQLLHQPGGHEFQKRSQYHPGEEDNQDTHGSPAHRYINHRIIKEYKIKQGSRAAVYRNYRSVQETAIHPFPAFNGYIGALIDPS